VLEVLFSLENSVSASFATAYYLPVKAYEANKSPVWPGLYALVCRHVGEGPALQRGGSSKSFLMSGLTLNFIYMFTIFLDGISGHRAQHLPWI
jgi:hypothetical protein